MGRAWNEWTIKHCLLLFRIPLLHIFISFAKNATKNHMSQKTSSNEKIGSSRKFSREMYNPWNLSLLA